MTLTFNSDKYRELLIKYQPKLIKTEEENERVLATVEELMHRPNRSLKENELYDLVITLIGYCKITRGYKSIPVRVSQRYSISGTALMD